MKIIYNPIFENELIHIVNYIAEDKPSASINFALELEKLILDIPLFHSNINHRLILTIKM